MDDRQPLASDLPQPLQSRIKGVVPFSRLQGRANEAEMAASAMDDDGERGMEGGEAEAEGGQRAGGGGSPTRPSAWAKAPGRDSGGKQGGGANEGIYAVDVDTATYKFGGHW